MAVNGLVVAIFPLPPALLSLRVDMYTLYGVIQYGVILYGVTLYGVTLYGVIQYGVIQYGVIQYGVILYHGQGGWSGSLLCCGMDAEQCKIQNKPSESVLAFCNCEFSPHTTTSTAGYVH